MENAQVLALEMLTYYAEIQAHKSLMTKQYGGPDGGEVPSMEAMEAGNNDFSVDDLRMVSQLKFSLFCETSILGTSDYSHLCSLFFHCVYILMGALLHVYYCTGSLLLASLLSLQVRLLVDIVMVGHCGGHCSDKSCHQMLANSYQ